ncbi:MAG: ribosome rescue GTPase HflX, partial [Xanthomonadales bacterium]|nr:ribosome rescue GTPase HflX [Xanthomonadales bacterium]
MIERADRGDRAVLLHPVFSDTGPEAIQEFTELARSAGVDVLASLTAPRDRPDARYFVGSGKAEELAASVAEHEADLVLVNAELSPVQERNLEQRCRCRVLDRTTLILDIFAQRAQSYEGKLQVELAQLRHLSTRLVRGWTHLERQKGGIGLRGPGETQLETDRRLIGQRIRLLRDRLDKVDRQRAQSRRRRERSEQPTVALVGYTNAGKSTLFNRLTDAGVQARNRLFDTLDPTVRRMQVASGDELLLADTVGFVSDLPHELVAAFRATLQETRSADLLLHVIDGSDPHRAEREHEVEAVLDEVGAGDIPEIRVINKIDRSGQDARVQRDDTGKPVSVYVSALEGDGLDLLAEAVVERLHGDRIRGWIRLEGRDARLRAQLFELGAVSEEQVDDSGAWRIRVDLSRASAERLARQPGRAGETAQRALL